MKPEDILNRLTFLKMVEQLKTVLCSARLSSGRKESAAEHSWRLCLWLLAFQDEFDNVDRERASGLSETLESLFSTFLFKRFGQTTSNLLNSSGSYDSNICHKYEPLADANVGTEPLAGAAINTTRS